MSGVEIDIRHLHSLVLVHNDINSSNELFDEDTNKDNSIIIDFDSWWPVEENLEGVGRTLEWYDESVNLFLRRNNWDGLYESWQCLSDNGTKNLKFKNW